MITLTGSRGFIGTHLRGFLSGSYEEFDLAIGKNHRDIVGRSGTLIHLSGWRKEDESYWHPEKYIDNNVRDLATLLTQNNFSRIIFPSSIAVYDERGELEPSSIYGLTKLMGEKLIKLYCPSYWILRIAHPYGRHDKMSVFYKLAQCKLTGEPFRLYSSFILRDYFPVTHIVSVIGDILNGRYPPSIYNVGSGREVYVFDFLKKLCDKHKIKYITVTSPIGTTPGFIPKENIIKCDQGDLEAAWLKYL